MFVSESERQRELDERAELRTAVRLILTIEEHPDTNPETIRLCPASRRQLRAAIGEASNADSLAAHMTDEEKRGPR